MDTVPTLAALCAMAGIAVGVIVARLLGRRRARAAAERSARLASAMRWARKDAEAVREALG